MRAVTEIYGLGSSLIRVIDKEPYRPNMFKRIIRRLSEIYHRLNQHIDVFFDQTTPRRTKACSYIFFFFHIVLGFYVLWLSYYRLNKAAADLNLSSHSLLIESAKETLFLILCVIWGNIGWDKFKQIKTEGKFSDLTQYLSAISFPFCFSVIGIIYLLELLISSKENNYSFPVWYYSAEISFVVFAFIFLAVSAVLKNR